MKKAKFFSKKGALNIVADFCDIDDEMSKRTNQKDDIEIVNLHRRVSLQIDRLVDRYEIDLNKISPRRRPHYRSSRGTKWRLKKILKDFEIRRIKPLFGVEF